MRYCLGPGCRDMTPLKGQQKYCALCLGTVIRERHRTESKRHMEKPDKRAAKLASNRRWWATVGAERRKARRVA